MSKKILSVALLVAMVFLLVPVASAAPLQAGGEDYTVAVADWLSKLADKYFGDILAFPAIMQATNQKHLEDDSYAFIDNADLIEPGWKLYVPSSEEADFSQFSNLS